MGFMDKIKAKATEMGLDEKAREAKEKAAEAAGQNRDKVEGMVGKAGQAINEKTDGKYKDKVSKAQDAALKGVDKIAEQSEQGAAASGAPASTSGDFADTTVQSENAIDRTVGQDGVRTDDAAGTGESPVQRAVGADATTSALDPNAPDRIADEQPHHLSADDATGSASGTQAGTPSGSQAGENEPTTDPEINEVRGTPQN